jgi:hypothetical protein
MRAIFSDPRRRRCPPARLATTPQCKPLTLAADDKSLNPATQPIDQPTVQVNYLYRDALRVQSLLRGLGRPQRTAAGGGDAHTLPGRWV